MQAVFVEWIDAALHDYDDGERGALTVSTGFLIENSREWLRIAQSLQDSEPSDILAIPKSLVKKMFIVGGRRGAHPRKH